jgi:predicted nucleotidyltransferase
VNGTPVISQTLRDAGAAVAWVFGSRGDGTGGPSSDVDIAVLSAAARPPLGLLELSGLARKLDPHLPGSVDLTVFERAPLELRARIVTQGRVLCSHDEPLRVRVTVDTQSRWEDVRPALHTMDQSYLAAVAERRPPVERRRG